MSHSFQNPKWSHLWQQTKHISQTKHQLLQIASDCLRFPEFPEFSPQAPGGSQHERPHERIRTSAQTRPRPHGWLHPILGTVDGCINIFDKILELMYL